MIPSKNYRYGSRRGDLACLSRLTGIHVNTIERWDRKGEILNGLLDWHLKRNRLMVLPIGGTPRKLKQKTP